LLFVFAQSVWLEGRFYPFTSMFYLWNYWTYFNYIWCWRMCIKVVTQSKIFFHISPIYTPILCQVEDMLFMSSKITQHKKIGMLQNVYLQIRFETSFSCSE
jgi:hypothetical protein